MRNAVAISLALSLLVARGPGGGEWMPHDTAAELGACRLLAIHRQTWPTLLAWFVEGVARAPSIDREAHNPCENERRKPTR